MLITLSVWNWRASAVIIQAFPFYCQRIRSDRRHWSSTVTRVDRCNVSWSEGHIRGANLFPHNSGFFIFECIKNDLRICSGGRKIRMKRNSKHIAISSINKCENSGVLAAIAGPRGLRGRVNAYKLTLFVQQWSFRERIISSSSEPTAPCATLVVGMGTLWRCMTTRATDLIPVPIIKARARVEPSPTYQWVRRKKRSRKEGN